MKQDSNNIILRATSCKIRGCQPSMTTTGLTTQPSGAQIGLQVGILLVQREEDDFGAFLFY